MKIFRSITQGGQVHIHQLLMFKQVFIVGILAAVLGGGGYFGWKVYALPTSLWRALYDVTASELFLAMSPADKHHTLALHKGKSYERKCLHIVHDPFLKRDMKNFQDYVKKAATLSGMLSGFVFCSVMLLWLMMGISGKRTQYQRGQTFVPWKTLKNILKQARQRSDLKLIRPWLKGGGALPLVKNKETSHILITGTTGSGKTNLFHHFLPRIRKRRSLVLRRPNRAIIVDVTGDYVSRYYDPRTDIILNPLDTRSPLWSPWADCKQDSHYDVLAEALIQPKGASSDPFWDTASRVVFKTALKKYAEHGMFDIDHLTTFLLSASDREFDHFFKGTEAATFSSKSNDKTTSSIRSVLSSQIACLKQLSQQDTKNAPIFSIRDWVKNEKHKGWLFITARADQRQTLTPLISAWVDIAINALMILPENQKRRLWLVIDELAALQRLPRLPMGLSEARKYGGCILIGFQSKPQLEDIYGKNTSDAMLDLFNTKIFFRCTEPSTQQWISKVLGEREEIEPHENISFGANSMRDGVSLSRKRRQIPIVLPSELSLLKDLECYIKYPGDYPSTKLHTRYKKSRFRSEPFLLIPEEDAGHPHQTEDSSGEYNQPAANARQEIEEEKES